MKILFVVEYYYPHIGGVETLFQNICERLVKRGHKVAVVTMQLSNTEKNEQIHGVRIHRVKCPNDSRYWFTFLAIPKVLEIIKEADIIHTTTYNGAFPAWVASKIYRKPCVITVHEIWGKLWGEFADMSKIVAWLHQFFEWLIINLGFDKYVGVSGYTAMQINKYGIVPAIVYNGIDYDFFNPERFDRKWLRQIFQLNDKFIYLFYGRPGLSKGLEYLINAIPIIQAKIPNSLAWIVMGYEPQDRQKMINRMINDFGLNINIKLNNPLTHDVLCEAIMASDCVVIPSLAEGFGFSAAEACAMGKPVVASNVASLPEVVSGKYILIKPKNPKAIAKGVIDVYNGKFRESKLKKFIWDKCIDGYEEIYKGLAK